MTIGVLALQGDFAAHGKALDKLAAPWKPISHPEELSGLSALVLPGGESTALIKLMTPLNFGEAICQFHQEGHALLGTCAGLILLANKVTPKQPSLNLINIQVERNGYGRQLESFIKSGELTITDHPNVEMVFIRAPRITHVATDVQIIATCQQEVVAARQGRVLVTAFHPEMSKDLTLYHYFIKIVTDEV